MTGDRQETAINIGMSCRLISESMNLVRTGGYRRPNGSHVDCVQVIINEETSHETHDFINKRLAAIKNQRNAGELEDLALIIGMTTVAHPRDVG